MDKVLHIITRLDMGGSAQNTLASCAGLADKYKIILAYGPTSESQMTDTEQKIVSEKLDAARSRGVKTFILPYLLRRISPIHDALCLIGIIRLIRLERPSIVHTHSSKAGLLGRLAAWMTKTPIILHTPHGHVFSGHFPNMAAKIFLLIEKVLDRITHTTIALTKGELDDYVRLKVSPERKLFRVHSGVDIGKFQRPDIEIGDLKLSLSIPPDVIVIGTVGWLLPIKGSMYLLEAMQRVWEENGTAHLVYVGKGALETDLKTKARESGRQQQVHFLGWREDVHNIMHLFDIFVLPSMNEGMGRVIVEAMAAGKPVVGSNVGGIPDLVVNGENGILVPPADSERLSDAIAELIADNVRRHRMGEIGKRRCLKFSTQAMIDRLDKLYRSCLT